MAPRLIGVDVGGTKIAIAALTGAGIGEAVLQATDTSGSEALVAQLERAVRDAGAGDAVGVAVPSVVDWDSGRVRASVNVPLRDVALRDVLRERLGVPVYVDNDATCAALGEAYGDDGELLARQLVMLTVGTGVGGGIVLDGRAYRGATGAAAELGHMLVGADLRHPPFAAGDGFPRPGSLEALASGRALNEIGRALGAEPGRVIDAARAGDAGAGGAIELLGRRLGVGIANVINALDPELVVIGGGVCAAGELLLGPAREEAARFALTGVGTRTEIRLARHGPLAGVRGAALLAAHELAADRDRAAPGAVAR